jgi:hypothetical protein
LFRRHSLFRRARQFHTRREPFSCINLRGRHRSNRGLI